MASTARATRSLPALAGACLVTALGMVVLPSAAGAATARGMSVSTPAGPIQAKPGAVVHTTLRIGNTTAKPMAVEVSLGHVGFGNDGSATVGDRPDPAWAQRVTLGVRQTRVAAGSYVDDPVTVAMPSKAVPDDYFVGFLVSQMVTTPGSVDVVTRIAALLDLQVPGARHNEVRLTSLDMPSILTGSRMAVSAVVDNPGRTFVTVWGEVHLEPFGSPEQVVAFPGRYTIAPGRSRVLRVTADVGAGIGPVDVQGFVFFNTRPSTVAQLESTGSTWLLNPLYLPAIPLAAIVVGVGVWWRSRRRRRERGGRGPGGGGSDGAPSLVPTGMGGKS